MKGIYIVTIGNKSFKVMVKWYCTNTTTIHLQGAKTNSPLIFYWKKYTPKSVW
jgi:hypothetical protein